MLPMYIKHCGTVPSKCSEDNVHVCGVFWNWFLSDHNVLIMCAHMLCEAAVLDSMSSECYKHCIDFQDMLYIRHSVCLPAVYRRRYALCMGLMCYCVYMN